MEMIKSTLNIQWNYQSVLENPNITMDFAQEIIKMGFKPLCVNAICNFDFKTDKQRFMEHKWQQILLLSFYDYYMENIVFDGTFLERIFMDNYMLKMVAKY